MGAEEVEGAVFYGDVGFFELDAAFADGFDFPALEDEAGFEAVFDEVVVEGFFVLYDAHDGVCFGLKSYILSVLPGRSIGMALVEKVVLVPYSAEQMFALVDNVADYPKFLPWCGGASVSGEGDVVQATVHINYHHVKHSFTTENTRRRPTLIDIRLMEGPFRHLDGSWHFIPLADSACKIELKLHYEFSSRLLELALGPVFHFIANNFVDAFIQRADQIYQGR